MTKARSETVCQTRHAVILAAGESKRTRPLTLHRPKPLIPLVGHPLLGHILDELVGIVERVTLVVGYRADDIRAWFGTTYRGMQIQYVHQHVANGTAGALLVVADQQDATGSSLLDEPFFLLYGDNLVSQTDIVEVCQLRYGMSALPVDDPTGFGILEVADGRVLRIIEKPPHAPPGSLANPGIFHFDQHVFPALRQITPSPRGEYELTDLIAALAQEQAVGYSVCEGYWVPVGNPWEALIASLFLLERRKGLRQNIHPEASIAAGCHIDGAVQIGRAHIGAGCRIIGPAYIGDNVRIAEGCTIDRSVIEADSTIGSGGTLEQAVVGTAANIGTGCLLQYSLLDDSVTLGDGVRLAGHLFTDFKPVAYTMQVLDQETMCRRGSVIARGVTVPPGTPLEPGSVLFPDAYSSPQ